MALITSDWCSLLGVESKIVDASEIFRLQNNTTPAPDNIKKYAVVPGGVTIYNSASLTHPGRILQV